MLAVILSLLLPASPARADGLDRPVNLWPLFYRRATPEGSETEALFWLYARRRAGDTSVTSVRPLFRHERAPERLKSRLFPLYDYRREGTQRTLGLIGLSPFTLASFDGDSARSSVSRRLLLWSYEARPGASALELPPLWADKRGPGDARRVSALGLPDILNLFEARREPASASSEWHALTVWSKSSPEDSYFHLWPLYGRRRQKTRSERSTLWPLAVWASDPDAGVSESRVWPLWERRTAPRDADEPPALGLNMALPLPLWYRATGRERAYRRLLYLHWAADGPGRRVRVTIPWYSFADARAGTSHRGFFPLYHGSRWGGRSFHLAPPLFFSWADEDFRLSVFFPFYYAQRQGNRSFDYFFPLYGRSVRDKTVTRRWLMFPLYARRSEPAAGETELDLLWPLFHVGRSSAAASTRLLPLYWSGRRGEDSFAAAPLYARFTRGGETRSVLFPLYWRLSAPGQDSRFLPPLGGLVRDHGERDFFALGLTPSLSLFQSLREPAAGRSVDRALLWFRRREPAAAADAFVPLFFRWHDPGQRGLVLFPLYASHDDLADGSRRRCALGLCGGFSLFELSEEPARGAHSLRALLYYDGTEGESRTTVLAPLYWRFADGPAVRTWLLPLYAARRAPGSRAAGFLGVSPRWSLWSRTEEGGAVETRLLWRLVRLRRGPDDSAVEFNPLFFTLREGSTRYTAVLGGLIGLETSPEGRKWRWFWVF
ncbi:MAG: hypothetical protein HY928_01310 [Elusimicrobia bacterium]|nr:hypothetical protein [Elusimicrobiota bacterium]